MTINNFYKTLSHEDKNCKRKNSSQEVSTNIWKPEVGRDGLATMAINGSIAKHLQRVLGSHRNPAGCSTCEHQEHNSEDEKGNSEIETDRKVQNNWSHRLFSSLGSEVGIRSLLPHMCSFFFYILNEQFCDLYVNFEN